MPGPGHMSGPMWQPTAPPDLGRLVAWHPQPVPVLPLLCLLGALLYGWAVWRLRRRGDDWPIGRTVSWTVGLLLVVGVTGTGVGGYSMALFSVHMLQHMVLSMLAPIPLLMGAPITLALRALPSGRGRRGAPRRVLLALLHSRFAQVLSSPVVAVSLFLLSLYGLYFTPVFDWAMSGFVGHTAMLIHFVAVGMLLFWGLLEVDPVPHPMRPPFRIVELFVTAPFHAFFGIAFMTSKDEVAGYFAHPMASWHLGALADQRVGGAIAWAFSEVPTLLVVIVVVVLWARSSDREARRVDRRADRDGDQERNAYNAWLAGLGQPHRQGHA